MLSIKNVLSTHGIRVEYYEGDEDAGCLDNVTHPKVGGVRIIVFFPEQVADILESFTDGDILRDPFLSLIRKLRKSCLEHDRGENLASDAQRFELRAFDYLLDPTIQDREIDHKTILPNSRNNINSDQDDTENGLESRSDGPNRLKFDSGRLLGSAAEACDEGVHRAAGGTLQRLIATDPIVQTASRISCRELEIAALAAIGLTNRQIAQRLFISIPTVKTHIRAVLRKLKIANRADIARALASLTALNSKSEAGEKARDACMDDACSISHQTAFH